MEPAPLLRQGHPPVTPALTLLLHHLEAGEAGEAGRRGRPFLGEGRGVTWGGDRVVDLGFAAGGPAWSGPGGP